SVFPAEYFPDALRNAVKEWSVTSGDPWLTRIANDQPLPAWWVGICTAEVFLQLP
ncbi:hypothetical protein HDU76_009746, partial [Blyttiomyces sp. JEL0837]